MILVKQESSATPDQTQNDAESLPAPQPREEQVQSAFDKAGATLFQGKTLDEQIADVRAQYEGSPQWMKAPNGEATRLTEKHWLQVRTPAFKAWFGDWEKLSQKDILEGKPVVSVSSKDIPIQGGSIITTAINWIKSNPIGTAKTAIGDVQVTNDGIRESFNHTRYPNKLAVLPAIKDTLEHGAYLGKIADISGQDVENHYFTAPVELDGEPKFVFIRVKEKKSGRSFYVHEVFVDEEIKKSETLHSALSEIGNRMQTVDPKQGKIKFSDLYRSIINDILAVNPSDVSAMRDNNGEPLVESLQLQSNQAARSADLRRFTRLRVI